MALWQIPWEEGPEQSWQEDLALQALSSYKWS